MVILDGQDKEIAQAMMIFNIGTLEYTQTMVMLNGDTMECAEAMPILDR